MENLSRIKVSLAYAGKTGILLTGQSGKDPVTVSKWCTNTTQPVLQMLEKISDLLEINIRKRIVDTHQNNRQYEQYRINKRGL